MSTNVNQIPPAINIINNGPPPLKMPDNVWDLTGWIIGWFIYAYLWIGGAALTIFLFRSSFNLEETLGKALIILIYPIIWLLGNIYKIGYEFIYCPLSHFVYNVFHVDIVQTFSETWLDYMDLLEKATSSIPVVGDITKLFNKGWHWLLTSDPKEAEKVEAAAEQDLTNYENAFDPAYGTYCGPNKKVACRTGERGLGRIRDIMTQKYWLCPTSYNNSPIGTGKPDKCTGNLTDWSKVS